MKKVVFLLIAFVSVGLFSSCNKDKNSPQQSQSKDEVFEFHKEMIITDTKGNTATLLIETHSKIALDDHTGNVLSLNVFRRDFSEIPSKPNNAAPISDDTDADIDVNKHVFLKVLDYHFNEGVTGFNIESSLDINNSDDGTLSRSNEYHYIFGSPFNVVGAVVYYTGESRSKEFMKVKLSKKTSSDNLFWQQLAKQKLYSPGDYFWYQGTTVWTEYRLKIGVKRKRGRGHSHTWAWLI